MTDTQTSGWPREGRVIGQGVELSYRDWGGPADTTPLLLLHGLASAARIWDLVAPTLARDRRVVALDQRGHGLSEKPTTGYDFATMVADDLAAADALGLGERFALAGHSWGANVALEFGAAHPERTAALLLVDGGFGMLRQRPGATWETISVQLAPPNFAGTPRETFLGWIHAEIPDARPEVDEIELNIVELRPDDTVGPRLSRENHLRILRAMWDEQPDQVYPAIQAPTLYVLAEPSGASADDGFLAAKRAGIVEARRLMTHAPSVEVEWMADTIHDIPLQRPDALATRMARFLAALG
ncbi:MAG TPA: alpha/beta hydrolase [Ktedonobacterales bacterium]|nr:alpha/beta hydrolase [Ktedonobacterales bacterium]